MKWPLLVIGILGFAFVELFTGSLGCGRIPVQVRGSVTDAGGTPIEGATLLTLFDPGIVHRPEDLQEHRDIARMHAELSRKDLVRLRSVVGSARTDASGAFEIIVGIGISHRYGGLTGIPWLTERGSAFTVARALLVEAEGHTPLVHETKDARWEERQEGDIVGTLHVGTIRVTR